MLDLRPQSNESTDDRIHEPMDITLRGILTFAVALVILSVIVMVSLRLIMGAFQKEERAELAARPPLFSDDDGQYAGPNLQENPNIDLVDLRNDEIRRLTTYSDKIGDGSARIPIDRAIEIVVERGLPTRGTAPAQAAPSETKGTP